MAGDQFSPRLGMTVDQLRGLCREPSPLQKLGAVVVASNHHPSHSPDLAIDGNPSTIWHTNWEPMAQPPHHLILDLKKPVRVRGLTYLPRQDMANGRIGKFELYATVIGQSWGEPIASGQWPNDAPLKTIRLEEGVEARFLKLVALSEVQGRPFAAVAEVDILVE
jgi:endo-alpha-N-acetylgalactosaminidase